MIGRLPTSLEVNDKSYEIRTDFRDVLLIFVAYNDVELTDQEKTLVMLEVLYKDFNNIDPVDYEEAILQGVAFIDGGREIEEKVRTTKKVLDWEQDEQLIFSAVNKVAGKETRISEYIHWWTFLGYFNEIGEGLLSTVINIRQKKNKGKKLEKYEQEFYRENKSLIDIKKKYTEEEQAEIDYLNKLLG